MYNQLHPLCSKSLLPPRYSGGTSRNLDLWETRDQLEGEAEAGIETEVALRDACLESVVGSSITLSVSISNHCAVQSSLSLALGEASSGFQGFDWSAVAFCG